MIQLPEPFVLQGKLNMLPTELIVVILGQLDVKSILRCKQACRLLHSVIESSTRLQYAIELAVAGMQDGPSHLVSAVRLDMLKAHQAAWKQFNWTIQKSISFLADTWELVGGVLGVETPDSCLSFTQIPSTHRGVEGKQWTIDITAFRVEDFSMDPSQDLLVAIEDRISPDASSFRIHFLSLSNGLPHHSAVNSTLLYTSEISSDGWIYDVRIFASHLGVMRDSAYEDRELLICNWKGGDIERQKIHGSQLLTFSFLNDRLLMLGTSCTINGIVTAALEIVDLECKSAEPVHVSHVEMICSFHFPILAPQADTVELSIQSEPSPSFSPHSAPNVPFSTSGKNRLFVVTYEIYDAYLGQENTYALLLPLSTLLSRIDALPASQTGLIFPWEQWGPYGTRLMALTLPEVWVCYAHGMKFVLLEPGQKLRLYDFNPLSIKRGLVSAEEVDHPLVEYLTDRTTEEGNMFATPVSTYLPSRITTIPLPTLPKDMRSAKAVMLSEDGIIMVAVSSDGQEFGVLSL